MTYVYSKHRELDDKKIGKGKKVLLKNIDNIR